MTEHPAGPRWEPASDMSDSRDPCHPAHLGEAEVRNGLTDIFEICTSCRACTGLCPAFVTLFDAVERCDGGDAGLLTPAQQDGVGDGCHHCGLCVARCPYGPGHDERSIDFAAAMVRLRAMRRSSRQLGSRRLRAARVLGARWTSSGASLGGRIGRTFDRILYRFAAHRSGRVRTLVAGATGVSAVRVLPPVARQRFSVWYRQWTVGRVTHLRPMTRTVALYPTCLVEYHEPGIGRDLVRVLDHNRIGCSVIGHDQCCGAPLLQSGDIDGFTRTATARVAALAQVGDEVDAVLVAQPECAAVIKNQYPRVVHSADALRVAELVVDPCDYLWRLGRTGIETNFPGEVPASITVHVSCHRRDETSASHRAGASAVRELMAATGARVDTVEACAGVGGWGGLSSARDVAAMSAARALGDSLEAAGIQVTVGECHLANVAMGQFTAGPVVHPVRVLARAYGLNDD